MRGRILQLMSVTAMIGVAAVASVGSQTPVGQTGSALKTSWGEPDLQGTWSDEYQIPLQRPARYKDKAFFTDAERADLDKLRATIQRNETRSVRGTEQDVAGAYNSVFVTRRYTGRRTSLISDPPDGRIPPLTLEVQKRNKEIREWQLALLEATDTCKNKLPGCEGGRYTGVPSPRRFDPFKEYPVNSINRMDNPEDHGLSYRCLSGQLPHFGSSLGHFIQIVQTPGSVSILYDSLQGQQWHRVIPVDGSPHLPANVRLWWGDSRGRWEGNTLVVDVTNFSGKMDFQGSRENLHLIERWTRTAPNSLDYVVTLDDPTTWTKPWTVNQEMVKQSDQANRIYAEPRCHEGNYSLTGALAGAREKDQAFAEGRGPDPATLNTTTPTDSATRIANQSGDEEADPLQ